MPKPKQRPRGRPFAPGTSGNPSGRPKVADDLRHARGVLKDDYERAIHKLLRLSKEDLQAHVKNTETPAIELAVGSILIGAVMKGCPLKLEALLARTIGPVPKQLEVTGADGEAFRPFAGVSSEQLDDVLGLVRGAIAKKES